MRVRATTTTTTAALSALALAGAVTACGGSSGLSKAELSKQANAICTAEQKAGEAVPAPSNIQDASQAAPYFDKIVPIIVGATTKLAALKPADEIKADWNAFLTQRKSLTTLMQTVQHKADAKDASGLADLSTEPDLAKKMAAAATKAGATACAQA